MSDKTTLISFRDGAYKKVTPTSWKHSQWMHFTLADGSVVSANPRNVNYIHIGVEGTAEPAKGSTQTPNPAFPIARNYSTKGDK